MLKFISPLITMRVHVLWIMLHSFTTVKNHITWWSPFEVIMSDKNNLAECPNSTGMPFIKL